MNATATTSTTAPRKPRAPRKPKAAPQELQASHTGRTLWEECGGEPVEPKAAAPATSKPSKPAKAPKAPKAIKVVEVTATGLTVEVDGELAKRSDAEISAAITAKLEAVAAKPAKPRKARTAKRENSEPKVIPLVLDAAGIQREQEIRLSHCVPMNARADFHCFGVGPSPMSESVQIRLRYIGKGGGVTPMVLASCACGVEVVVTDAEGLAEFAVHHDGCFGPAAVPGYEDGEALRPMIPLNPMKLDLEIDASTYREYTREQEVRDGILHQLTMGYLTSRSFESKAGKLMVEYDEHPERGTVRGWPVKEYRAHCPCGAKIRCIHDARATRDGKLVSFIMDHHGCGIRKPRTEVVQADPVTEVVQASAPVVVPPAPPAAPAPVAPVAQLSFWSSIKAALIGPRPVRPLYEVADDFGHLLDGGRTFTSWADADKFLRRKLGASFQSYRRFYSIQLVQGCI